MKIRPIMYYTPAFIHGFDKDQKSLGANVNLFGIETFVSLSIFNELLMEIKND